MYTSLMTWTYSSLHESPVSLEIHFYLTICSHVKQRSWPTSTMGFLSNKTPVNGWLVIAKSTKLGVWLSAPGMMSMRERHIYNHQVSQSVIMNEPRHAKTTSLKHGQNIECIKGTSTPYAAIMLCNQIVFKSLCTERLALKFCTPSIFLHSNFCPPPCLRPPL